VRPFGTIEKDRARLIAGFAPLSQCPPPYLP
jgi:hypothetical protein